MKHFKIALAGQPNCGKSTIFNMLSGVKQHIANYPGITVDKKSAFFTLEEAKIELVDLPGIYSLSSFSPEERVTRNFLLNEKPDLIINVIDASNLTRHLYLTTQLCEMGIPILLVLNMMDIAKKKGLHVNPIELELFFGIRAICTIGKERKGKELFLKILIEILFSKTIFPKPISFASIKSEPDSLDKTVEMQYIASKRYDEASKASKLATIKYTSTANQTTQKIDAIMLHRWLGIPLMLLVIYGLYELAIVQGYKVTNYTWPILAWFKQSIVLFLPPETLSEVPLLREFGIWMVNSLNALLNYIPIFFILFSLIAILEDSGYMVRMAFLLDRIFKAYGLHGQSTLPYVLGGVFVGGCAVPAIMATKGMSDNRARIATILTIPFLNCLAKIPFFILIVSVFFVEYQSMAMFFISTITIIVALIVAKILSFTLLRHHESAPFIMELPAYHFPTLQGILSSSYQKIWLYLKKVATTVLSIAVILFVLIQFPGVSSERKIEVNLTMHEAYLAYEGVLKQTQFYEALKGESQLIALLDYEQRYKQERMNASSQKAAKHADETYQRENALFFTILKDRANQEAQIIDKELKKIILLRKNLFRAVKETKVENSYLGRLGKSVEDLTRHAGFDWRINVAFLSSFAARESFVATLGALFEPENTLERVDQSIKEIGRYAPLAGLAMILFMALTPPCIATMVVLKIQLSSWRWMIFALIYPLILGLIVAIGVYSLGTIFELSVLHVMMGVYAIALLVLVFLGFIPLNRFKS